MADSETAAPRVRRIACTRDRAFRHVPQRRGSTFAVRVRTIPPGDFARCAWCPRDVSRLR